VFWEKVFWEKVETLLDVIVVLLLLNTLFFKLTGQDEYYTLDIIQIENLLEPGLYYVKQKTF